MFTSLYPENRMIERNNGTSRTGYVRIICPNTPENEAVFAMIRQSVRRGKAFPTDARLQNSLGMKTIYAHSDSIRETRLLHHGNDISLEVDIYHRTAERRDCLLYDGFRTLMQEVFPNDRAEATC